MAHLHLVVSIPDADPTTEDPDEAADRLIEWRRIPLRGHEPTVAGARWPLTRDQLRARLLETFPGRLPDEGDQLVATVAEMLDAVEALLNPPWED